MAKLEFQPTTLEEYNRGKRQRIFVGDLALDGVYKVMSRDTSGNSGNGVRFFEAMAQVMDLEPGRNGMYLVEFYLLDTQLQPHTRYRSSFRDAYLYSHGAGGSQLNERGYFRASGSSLGMPARSEGVTIGSPDLPPDTPIDELVEAYMP